MHGFFDLGCFVYWGYGPRVGRQVVNVWAVGVFLSQYLKDLLMVPLLQTIEPSLKPVCASKGLKKIYLETRTSWDLPNEPIVSFVSATFIVTLLLNSFLPFYGATTSLVAYAAVGASAFSFVYLGIHSSPSQYGSAMIGLLLPVLWVYHGDTFDKYLFACGNSIIANAIVIPLAVFFMLLAYPIPFKYSCAFPRVAISLATSAGFNVGANICGLGVTPAIPTETRSCPTFLSTHYTRTMTRLRGSQDIFQLLHLIPFDSNETVGLSTECFYQALTRSFLGFLICLVLRFGINVSIKLYGPSPKNMMYMSCFRPRLSANALSVLEGCSHRFLPSVEEAQEQLYEARHYCQSYKSEQRNSQKQKKSHFKLQPSKEQDSNSTHYLMAARNNHVFEYAVPSNFFLGIMDGLLCSAVVPACLKYVHP